MSPLESIALGLCLGFIGVGLPTLRIMKVMEGKFISVFFIGILSSISLYVFTNMVVLKNYPFMIANAIGAASSVSFLAWRKQNEKTT